MIYFLLILFFTSLFSIIFMIGKKLFLLQNGQIITSNIEVLFRISHLEKIKLFTIKNIKKYGHILLVEILRSYIRFSNFLKNKYQEIKIKIKTLGKKNNPNGEEKEISKFLRIIGDYKNKIREIKHKIKKEENL
ncbi:hypothetical protein A2641_02855 [Candidatus Nomurabacteria bacterium RIFCSPHIGHO2_01_FULL_37_25]|uniref:Uncharacterized protein n=1 Tax=Candidatus Nomurabacteria bacterium RIFCSPLOWO2_01_FULL_36_16 TaxID=1801767 RepID=A0A1F6X0C1_9BACT|nr:MAG: hypothetical protein A2641_02855 [Candidatus Nomurabacteria bacterium RIFCSPHIGHO2_01_FULL_37_25]OGI75088.1 MAG: hypothetical protein A3D36_03600 [Candidatus Nomurabacteria bacterium RIFCSPHIGHO2_02_FULL_36_29]OGI87599.1 MAG: hypothetical protein A3A91_01670 [Candidatus Nomurabacteria bacterium RIFCSPLOWO2_01_FULL_36_16]